MAKRRTKKQKAKAKHRFNTRKQLTATAEIKAKSSQSEANVKRQFKNTEAELEQKEPKNKIAKDKGKINNLASVKKDVVKSLGLAGIILGLELVIYFSWYVQK